MPSKRQQSCWAVLASIAVAMLAVAALTASAGATSQTPALANANSVTYQDSTGDAPNTLDVGAVAVSNTDSGQISFEIRFVNRGVASEMDNVFVYVDSVPGAGDPDLGAEWFIGQVGPGFTGLASWNGSDWVFRAGATASLSERGVILTVGAKEIGSPTSFRFRVLTVTGREDEEPLGMDAAPNVLDDTWQYEVKTYLKPVLTGSQLALKPDPPKAGKALVARMAVEVLRGDATEPLGSTATVVGLAKVAGVKLVGKVAPSYTQGKIAVTFKVPKAAQGKLMRGSLTVALEGVTLKRTFAEKVALLKPTLKASKVSVRPDPPKAGKAMVAKMTVKVTRGGLPSKLSAKAKVVGVANVAGKKIVGKVAPGYGKGKIAVTFKVPKTAQGKLLRGYVKATLDGVSKKQAFSERVA